MKTVNSIHLSDLDTCVTVVEPANQGDTVLFTENGVEKNVAAREAVPAWHKVAVKPVKAGGGVYKYGSVIGVALKDIAEGEHVHVHNMRSPEAGGKL